MQKIVSNGWILIISGALIIGIGGVLSTYGWNLMNRVSQVKSLIIAVAREWEINDKILNDQLFTSNNEALLGAHLLYPRFKVNALNNILSSGYLSSSDLKTKELLRGVVNYEITIEDVNARLAVSDNYIVNQKEGKSIADHRKYVMTSKGLLSFKNQHESMKKLLSSDYAWATAETFLKE